jgi:adenine phosphoribosyltransferase
MASLPARVRASLRDVPDFPRPGILFKDITPLLGEAALFAEVVAAMAEAHCGAGITHVAGIESRGFILGAPVAIALGAGFVPVRKPGKLPAPVLSSEYALEYGADRLELHADAVGPGARVLLVDDVLATGGTALAAAQLVEEAGAVLAGCTFLLAIGALGGRQRLAHRTTTVLLEL